MRKEILATYKIAKQTARRVGKESMFGRMCFQNLQDLLPTDWELYIYSPQMIRLTAPDEVPMNEALKIVDKLARKLNIEPEKTISEYQFTSTFQLSYQRKSSIVFPNSVWKSFYFELCSKNTEKCEVTYKRKMKKIPVLTGYCKEVAEKKHLETVANENREEDVFV